MNHINQFLYAITKEQAYTTLAYVLLSIVLWLTILTLKPVFKNISKQGLQLDKVNYIFYLKQNTRLCIVYIVLSLVMRSICNYFRWGNPIEITFEIISMFVSGIIASIVITPFLQAWYKNLEKK